jgi:hypothetical protein
MMQRTTKVMLTLVTEHAPAELAKRLAAGRGIRSKGGDGGEWLGCGQVRSAYEVDLGPSESAPQIAVAPVPDPPAAPIDDDSGSFGASRRSQRTAPRAYPDPAPASKPKRKAKRRTRR